MFSAVSLSYNASGTSSYFKYICLVADNAGILIKWGIVKNVKIA